MAMVCALAVACGGPGDEAAEPPIEEELAPVDQLARASVALRGLRPSAEDLARVQADPSQVDVIIEEYVQSDAFGEVLADMHAEQLLIRADPMPRLGLPQRGPMSGIPRGVSQPAESEWPLQLVRHVATNDLPYTEVVLADYTFSNPVTAIAFGMPHEEDGPYWQKVPWPDARPGAGLLSETAMWRRHDSNGFNFNRLRADFIADTFLCDPIGGRDVTIEGSLAVSDPDEVAVAVSTQPECIACHQALDPLGGFLWGFKPMISKAAITQAYQADCGEAERYDFDYTGDVRDFCYPIRAYSPESEDMWDYWGLRAPGYYGAPGHYLDDLGNYIAEDPRFATCTVRRFYGWFAQMEPEAVPYEVVEPLTDAFIDSGWSTQQLAATILTRPEFRSTGPDGLGLLATRPEQYARTIEALTGFRWRAQVDDGECTQCWGEVDLGRTSLFGYHMVAGGVDGDDVITPTHTTTPMKWLALSAWAQDAAGHAVSQALAGAPTVTGLDAPRDTDEAAVRRQLVAVTETVLTEPLASDDPEIDELYGLFVDARAGATGDDAAYAGWTAVLTALFLDPRLMLH